MPREIEVLGHDADHAVRFAVHRDGFAEHVAAHAEFLAPKNVAQDNDLFVPGFPFRFEEGAAERGSRAQSREKRRRDLLTDRQLGFAAAGDGEARAGHGREVFEELALIAPGGELAGGKRNAFFLRQILPEHHEPVGLREGRPFQQHRVHDREHQPGRCRDRNEWIVELVVELLLGEHEGEDHRAASCAAGCPLMSCPLSPSVS